MTGNTTTKAWCHHDWYTSQRIAASHFTRTESHVKGKKTAIPLRNSHNLIIVQQIATFHFARTESHCHMC
jgi:hypothetical protein